MPQMPMKLAWIPLAAALLAATPAKAENSVEDWSWVADHFEVFGIWEAVCDHREADGKTLRRCYVSFVDVYAPRPKFGAAFVFLTQDGNGPRLEFRFESGTDFVDDAVALTGAGGVRWQIAPGQCPKLKCIVEGETAAAFLRQLDAPGELRTVFRDRHGRDWDRRWNVEGLRAAYEDMQAAAKERGL
jgi:hypothetical protein